MIKVKLRDLKKGDNVAIFRPYEKEKYTIIDVGLREDSNGEEVVGVVMRSDAGHVRVPPYMPADNEVTLWEEFTEDTIFQELYSVYYSGDKTFRDIYNNASINGIILEDSKQGIETERIYALYKGKIELIWEREE